MKRGPKPTPTAILKLRGSWRAEKRTDDVSFNPGAPAKPAFLRGLAAKEWWNILPKLEKMGLVSECDYALLASYCYYYAEWIKVCRMIEKLPSFLTTQPSGRLCQHPLLRVRDSTAELLRKTANEFGMSPCSRAGLNLLPKIDRSKTSKKRFFSPKKENETA